MISAGSLLWFILLTPPFCVHERYVISSNLSIATPLFQLCFLLELTIFLLAHWAQAYSCGQVFSVPDPNNPSVHHFNIKAGLRYHQCKLEKMWTQNV